MDYMELALYVVVGVVAFLVLCSCVGTVCWKFQGGGQLCTCLPGCHNWRNTEPVNILQLSYYFRGTE